MHGANEKGGDVDGATVITSNELLPGAGGNVPTIVLAAGTTIGQYVVERLVGYGGCGAVYAARHSVLGRRVAIKVLRAEAARYPQMVTRFVLEATSVNKIGHPSIVDIYEFGETAPGAPYYVMELLDGVDLRAYVQTHGRFTPTEMLSLLTPICEAVQAAHEAGIVHRDIKASNVVVVLRSGKPVTKLLDFGIAKITQGDHLGQGLTEPGVQLGSPHSMAPEQIRCEPVDARTDIYALGVLIYQLLTGRYPFDAPEPYQVALQHLRTPAPRPSAILPLPPALDAVVRRCLEKLPEKRFASVTELLAALNDAVGEGGAVALTSSAVGIHVCVSGRGGEELDDDMGEAMGDLLDTVEQTLVRRSFTVAMHMSDALLGVRLVAPADMANAKQVAQEFIDELRAHLDARPDADARLVVSLRMSVQQAVYRPSPDGVEVVGGPILDIETWT